MKNSYILLYCIYCIIASQNIINEINILEEKIKNGEKTLKDLSNTCNNFVKDLDMARSKLVELRNKQSRIEMESSMNLDIKYLNETKSHIFLQERTIEKLHDSLISAANLHNSQKNEIDANKNHLMSLQIMLLLGANM